MPIIHRTEVLLPGELATLPFILLALMRSLGSFGARVRITPFILPLDDSLTYTPQDGQCSLGLESKSFARPCIVIRGLSRFYKETFFKTSNADKVDSSS